MMQHRKKTYHADSQVTRRAFVNGVQHRSQLLRVLALLDVRLKHPTKSTDGWVSTGCGCFEYSPNNAALALGFRTGGK